MDGKEGNPTQSLTNQSISSIDVQQHNTELEQIDELYSKCKGIEIREITITKLQELLASEQFTSVELTQCYLNRIKHLNEALKCVIEVNPDAISEATRTDLERTNGSIRSQMHGIPILIKDNIATCDSMLTTSGSLALMNCHPKCDADVVKLLREAGAVILGKANTSEFAFWRGTNIPDGWSGRGGHTKNAYNLNESPEGSSSGSAVAVAANLVAVSIGTETDGSLLAPASVAGICAMKPTHGLVSTNKVIPISHNQDTVGPMARTVMDLAILLDAMVTLDAKHTLDEGSYANCVTRRPYLKKFRLGVIRHPYWDANVIKSAYLQYELPFLENILLALKISSDFEVLDPVNPTPGLVTSISKLKELTVLRHDFKHDINEYLKNEVITPQSLTCLKDIIKFNEENPTIEGYDQQLLIESEATDGLENSKYIEARDSNRAKARELLDSVLINHHLNAVLFPSETRSDSTDVSDAEFIDTPLMGCNLAAIAGYPSLNIPAGIGLKGEPYGITLVALPKQESTLLQMAYLIEQMNTKRSIPKYLN